MAAALPKPTANPHLRRTDASAISTPAENPRLNRADAAEYLGVTVPTMASWACRGCGPPFIKLGSKVVYLQSDLDQWLIERRVYSTSELH